MPTRDLQRSRLLATLQGRGGALLTQLQGPSHAFVRLLAARRLERKAVRRAHRGALLGLLESRAATLEPAERPGAQRRLLSLMDAWQRHRLREALEPFAPTSQAWQDALASMPSPSSASFDHFFQARISSSPGAESGLLWTLAWGHARLLLGQDVRPLDDGLFVGGGFAACLRDVELLDLAARLADAEASAAQWRGERGRWRPYARSLWQLAFSRLQEEKRKEAGEAPVASAGGEASEEGASEELGTSLVESWSEEEAETCVLGWQFWCLVRCCGALWEDDAIVQAQHVFFGELLPWVAQQAVEPEGERSEKALSWLDMVLACPPPDEVAAAPTARVSWEDGAAGLSHDGSAASLPKDGAATAPTISQRQETPIDGAVTAPTAPAWERDWLWHLMRLAVYVCEGGWFFHDTDEGLEQELEHLTASSFAPSVFVLRSALSVLERFRGYDGEGYALVLARWLLSQRPQEPQAIRLQVEVLSHLDACLRWHDEEEEESLQCFASFARELPAGFAQEAAVASRLWALEMRRARHLHAQEEAEGAAAAYTQAVAWAEASGVPEAAQAHLSFVSVFPEQTEAMMRRALSLLDGHRSPTQEEVTNKLAAVLLARGEVREAQQLLRDLLDGMGARPYSLSQELRARLALSQSLDEGSPERQAQASLIQTCKARMQRAHQAECDSYDDGNEFFLRYLRAVPEQEPELGWYAQTLYSRWDIEGKAWLEEEEPAVYLERQNLQKTPDTWEPGASLDCGCECFWSDSRDDYWWGPCGACYRELVTRYQGSMLKLAAPVLHPWCFHGARTLLGDWLGLRRNQVLALLREELFVVTYQGWNIGGRFGMQELLFGEVIPAAQVEQVAAWSTPPKLRTGIVGLREVLQDLRAYTVARALEKAPAKKRDEIATRLALLEAYEREGMTEGFSLEQMILTVIPVLPASYLSNVGLPVKRIQACVYALLEENQRIRQAFPHTASEPWQVPWQETLQDKVKALFAAFRSRPKPRRHGK